MQLLKSVVLEEDFIQVAIEWAYLREVLIVRFRASCRVNADVVALAEHLKD